MQIDKSRGSAVFKKQKNDKNRAKIKPGDKKDNGCSKK